MAFRTIDNTLEHYSILIANPSETREGEIGAWYEVREAGRSELKIWGTSRKTWKGVKEVWTGFGGPEKELLSCDRESGRPG